MPITLTTTTVSLSALNLLKIYTLKPGYVVVYILELDKAISLFHFQNYFQRKNGIASIQESYNLSEIDAAASPQSFRLDTFSF